MAQLLQPETGTTDPRILRSRRMLMDSLERLLKKKEFEDISVQAIADDATLNRATFYLHYPDKNALLQAMTGVRFRDLIERRGITFTAQQLCGDPGRRRLHRRWLPRAQPLDHPRRIDG